MKKLLLYAFISIFVIGGIETAQGQVTNAIKRSSSSSSSSSSGAKVSGGGGDLGSSAACFSSCFDVGCQLIGTGIVTGVLRYHDALLDKGIGRVTSVELQVIGGGNAINNYYTFRPRLRGNWGLFSTDFRIAMLYDYVPEDDSFGSYHTKDWQIIGLNLVAAQAFNLRLSSGFMYQDYDKKYAWENALAADVYFDRWQIGAEGRIAAAPNTGGVLPRTELSLKTTYQLNQRKHIQSYLMAEGVYNKYFGEVETWTLGVGVGFRYQ